MASPAATAPRQLPRSSPETAGSAEVVYPSRCYRALAPAHLAAACAAHGVHAPAADGPVEYCEVGCGTGLTLAVLAAANPDARFTGIEHDTGHARRANELAAACGLANLRILDADIARFESLALPRFDYIALHGVYSWVAEDVRAVLRAFIGEHLARGGVSYLSYNALPGWNGVLPLRDWLQRRAALLPGSLAERALNARDQLLVLLDEGLPFFTDTPIAAAVAADLRDAEAGYIVHEYLMPGWQALACNEVHHALHDAGLSYAGDAELPGRALVCGEHAACRAAAELDDPGMVESELDFLHNRFFRRDLYMRTEDVQQAGDAAFDEVLLTALVPPDRLGEDIEGVDPLVLTGLRHLMDGAVWRYGELRAAGPLRALPGASVRAAVLTLIGATELVPCARRATPATLDTAALGGANRVLLDRFGLLASPVSGGVIAPDATEMRVLADSRVHARAALPRLAGLRALPAPPPPSPAVP